MLRNLIMLMSGFIVFMATASRADAAGYYVVSFVVGQTRLGLVYINQSDTGIEVRQISITPMGKAIGSTAAITLRSAWDYGYTIEVFTTYAGSAAQPIRLGRVRFDEGLNRTSEITVFPQVPGAYHPLHRFRYRQFKPDGGADPGYLLRAGSFGTSGANDYVSHLLYGGPQATIFLNPDYRSPGTAAVAPDGGLVSQMTYRGLNHIGLIGKLLGGKLAGSPIRWLSVNAFQGYSQSLSNPIGSRRYLAYRNFMEPGTANSKSQVVIRNVDAQTGQPLGNPRNITWFAKAVNVEAEKSQSIAIAPDGDLILYTIWSTACQKQVLVARRLLTGYSAGTPTVVVGCGQLEQYQVGVYGINITQPF